MRDLRVKELITQIRIFQSVGKADEAARLMKAYGEVFSKPMPEDLAKMNVVAEIVRCSTMKIRQ